MLYNVLFYVMLRYITCYFMLSYITKTCYITYVYVMLCNMLSYVL